MARVLVALTYLLGGCASVFDLDKVPDVAPRPDAPIGVDDDGDGVFADDDCPTIADPDQLDDDGDGVGNACDPHPGEHDEVVLQELFDGDAPNWDAPGAWTRTPGAWTSPPAFDGDSVFAYTLPRELYRPTIQVAFTIVSYASTSGIRELIAHLDAPSETGDCSFRNNPANTGPKSQIILHVGATGPQGGNVADWVFGERYLGTYSRALTSVCSADAQRFQRTDDTVERFTTAPVLAIRRMQVTLHHVTIYQVIP